MNIHILSQNAPEFLITNLRHVYPDSTIKEGLYCDDCSVFDLIIVCTNCDENLLTYIATFRCAKYAIDVDLSSYALHLTNQFQKIISLTDICHTNACSMLKMKEKILIVGNSTYLLGKMKGDFIDSFDNVVRINRFNLEKNHSDIGSRITHVLLNHSEVTLGPNFEKYHHLPLYVNWNPNCLKTKNLKKRKRNKNTWNLLQQKLYTCISLQNDTKKKYGFSKTPGNKASVGMTLILHLLEESINDLDIYIINFGYDNCKSNINNTPNNSTHNIQKETHLFEKMHSQFRITFLK